MKYTIVANVVAIVAALAGTGAAAVVLVAADAILILLCTKFNAA